MEEKNPDVYMDARNRAIQEVNIKFYGESFPKKLKSLWERLPSEPTVVADEAKSWLGIWHPEAIKISHEAVLLVRKKL